MLPVQLTVNNAAAQKQSLQSIAEQTVSITRTKIQELKAENPDRRLILIGMSSASALALQVALVEQVSGVICFGFSYNTVHGARGQADDHFLDLTTPVLFLVGQNAARASEEEIEFFRAKLTAPTSTVIVGAADDYLRVSKTKRRLEGVTQEMVDNMVVDEIAEFASICVQRQLPAKVKNTTLSGNGIRREIDSSTVGQGRKRKTSINGDLDGVKGVTIKAQKLMKPTSTSDEVLEMAVQSILPDHEEMIPAQTIKAPPSKLNVNRIIIGPTGSYQKKSTTQTNLFTSIKQQPVNQTKYVTITGHKNGQKNVQLQTRTVPRPAINNSRPITPTNQAKYIVSNRGPNNNKTLTTPQQPLQSFSPTKYTIVRSSSNTPNISYMNESSTDLSGTNIFDMPIVFADNEGNIDEDASTMSEGSVISVASDSPPQTLKQVVLNTPKFAGQSFTITKNKNVLIQKPTAGKMFIINGTVIGKQVPLPANNNILPKAHNSQQMKLTKFVPGTKMAQTTTPVVGGGKKIEILNNTIIRPASTSSNLTKVQSTSFINLADGKPIGNTRLSLPIMSSASSIKKQIVIKTNALKPYTGAQILPSISGSKQLGNLTVKRLNVVPSASISKVFKKN